MLRPQLTVKTTKGINYDAQSVHINFDCTVTFFSSGNPVTLKAEEVVSVEYNASGAGWCPNCDQSIQHFIKA